MTVDRDIERRLATGGTTVTAVRLALKLAWERGILTYRNASPGWNQERRTFALTTHAHPDLDLTIDRRQATAQLVDTYFDRYGPASLRDAMWWSGLSCTAILAALADIGKPLVAVNAPWSTSTLYIYRDRLEQFHRDQQRDEPLTGLNFLAHEDVACKAYFDSRRRYLGDLDERRAFNQIGEVLPTIVVDGQVVGTWGWDARREAVTYTLVSDLVGRDLRRRIKKRAEGTSLALRLGHASSCSATRPTRWLERATTISVT
ncbi:DNA glycosylase AlkZ-like family protein [Micromonospora sp. NPDC003197]